MSGSLRDVATTPLAGQARWMLLRAFLAQNVVIGCAFGGFSVSVLAIQERFEATRGLAAMGLALTVLAMGLLGPVSARLIIRNGLRTTMLLGLLLSGSGYVLLAAAPNMTVVLAAYGLLIGPGLALCGSVPTSLLAGGWYPQRRGRAVGLANVPLLIALIPLLGLGIIQRFGLPSFFLALAALHLLLLPFLLGIADPPSVPRSTVDGKKGDHATTAPADARAVLSRPLFWVMVLGGGTLNAAGITGISHMVALAVEKGVQVDLAALLVSVMGAAAILGSMLSGFLADRIGAARTLALVGSGFAASWLVIGTSSWLPAMIPAVFVLGICGPAIYPPVNIMAAQAFGIAALPRAIGFFGLFTLPLTFCLPPAAGWVRDITGDYGLVTIIVIGACGAVAALFLLVARAMGRSARKAPSFGVA